MRLLTGIIVLLLSAPVWAASSTAPKKMQCWTDHNGKRACGDRVPPEYAKGERQKLDSQGRVIGTQARQKTPEEIAVAEAAQKAITLEKERLVKQTAYDKYLLQTFSSVAEMQGVRDSRVGSIEGRIKLAERGIAESEVSLKNLKDRAAALTRDGKPVDAKLTKQISTYEISLVDSLRVVAQLKIEREQTQLRFTDDIARFRGLRAGEIQIGSTPPPSANLSAPAPPAP